MQVTITSAYGEDAQDIIDKLASGRVDRGHICPGCAIGPPAAAPLPPRGHSSAPLELQCQSEENDSINFSDWDDAEIWVEAHQAAQTSGAKLDLDQAVQLRNWLNDFIIKNGGQ